MSNRKSYREGPDEWPTLDENHWYVLAIASAIFTAIAILGAFIWIFGDGFDGDPDVRKAQAIAPFGVALFAVVTFCTASWRGSINTRQANQAESEGRAKLLQEGAKLLADTGKASHVSAGVASLGVLVAGSDSDYAFQAMNLLADFVEDHMRVDHTNRHRPQISGIMRSGEQKGYTTGRDISFDCTNYDPDPNDYGEDEPSFWHYIPGFQTIRYKSGIFAHDMNYRLQDLKNLNFDSVEIRGWNNIEVNDRFYRCRFSDCDIISFSSLLSLSSHNSYEYAFSQCDFSGCEIYDRDLITKDLKKHKNYFLKGNPPTLIGSPEAIDWDQILLCEEKKPDYGFFSF